ncbi:MAG: hypothetical protein JWN72_1715 [Thermoleophilia bacterium]|nr:hypothetical protein [Thermoleophilia bacterium]
MSLVGATDRSAPTLGTIIDREAAVFDVIGSGPMGGRRLAPVTTLARTALADPALSGRIRAMLGSLDDLTGDVHVDRASFATTARASAGVGLLSDLRTTRVRPGDDERAISDLSRYSGTHVPKSGYYHYAANELVLSPRVSRYVFGADASPPDPASGRPFPIEYAARIPAHELFHGVGAWAADAPRSPTEDGMRESTASIIGTLRASSLARDLEGAARGPMLEADRLQSHYDEYTKVVTSLARTGGRDLDQPSSVAAFERQLATTEPVRLLHDLAYAAARATGGSMPVIRDAAVAALHASNSSIFVDRLATVGVTAADASLDWLYREGTRRGQVPPSS